jgi:hypothetical protein
MASTTERGYGWAHQQLRAALIATYSPVDPCWRCTLPLGPYPNCSTSATSMATRAVTPASSTAGAVGAPAPATAISSAAAARPDGAEPGDAGHHPKHRHRPGLAGGDLGGG